MRKQADAYEHSYGIDFDRRTDKLATRVIALAACAGLTLHQGKGQCSLFWDEKIKVFIKG